MAAMTSSSLLLSTAEEALLPSYLACASKKGATPADFDPVGAAVCLDGDNMAFIDADHQGTRNSASASSGGRSMAMATPIDASLASLTVCVESSILLAETTSTTGHAASKNDIEATHALLEGARSNAIAALNAYRRRVGELNDRDETAEATKVARLHAAAAVAHAAQLLHYGDTILDRRRSITIALCSSLLPRYFPHGHALTFMASLLPGLCESADNYINESIRIGDQEIYDFKRWSDEITNKFEVPKLVTLAEGTPDVDTLMKRVDDISVLLGSEESSRYNFVEAVLHRSLNR